MTARSHVLIITDDLGGGTGNHLLQMIRHWDKSRWDVRILSLARLTARLAPDVPVTFLAPLRRFKRYPLGQVRRLLQVNRFVRKHRPAIVHAYFFWPIIYARLLKYFGTIRCLIENREDQGFNWGRHEYWLLKLTRTRPDHVICVSDAVRRVALEREKLDPERVSVIRNGIAPAAARVEARAAMRRELGFREDHLVVGMVANLNRSIKGVAYFLDAIPLIRQAVPAARFVILGRGREEQALREKADRLGISPYLVFAGYRENVADFYVAMDISVLTSLSEGLSITLLESMNYGVPVVATRVGGNPEVVVDGHTGYLVPATDAAAFASRVAELLENRELCARMGRAGRRRIEERFQIRDVAGRYLRVYADALRAAGSSGSAQLTGRP